MPHKPEPTVVTRGIPLEEQTNFESLHTETRLVKAEVYRELGKFEDAERLLEQPFSDAMTPAVDLIRELVRQREQKVTELRF